jgi:hypothetical protein
MIGTINALMHKTLYLIFQLLLELVLIKRKVARQYTNLDTRIAQPWLIGMSKSNSCNPFVIRVIKQYVITGVTSHQVYSFLPFK